MNHNLFAENFGVQLRPVAMEDAEFIHQLRRNPDLSKHIGEVDKRLSIHKAWLEAYFNRDGDYYFCIQLDPGVTIGTIAIYNVTGQTAEWGRWIISPTYPAAAASAWLIYHVAFDILGLSSVYCRSVLDNKHVVSFHDHCGLVRSGIEHEGIKIHDEWKDMIVHTASSEQWPVIQSKLARPAKLSKRFLLGVTE